MTNKETSANGETPMFRENEESREALPIFCEEQAVIEAIKTYPVVFIGGDAGIGKSSQVPQFLFQAGFTKNKIIGITEPRRIAAMSIADRVGKELSAPEKVSYHVRYEKNVTKNTEVKFMTDGVLLREITEDYLLTNYSVIIIDEAHERTVCSDVLIGHLSGIISRRAEEGDPLKLVIMSTTSAMENFRKDATLFKDSPCFIEIKCSQLEFEIHFEIETPEDYMNAAYEKVCWIHSKHPTGTILVFLTGEQEILLLVKILRKKFPFKKSQQATNFSIEPLDSENLENQQSDDREETPVCNLVPGVSEGVSPLYVLPLYSALPFHDQDKIFNPHPKGTRLVIVATNVAETSITIPGVKYVVDTGKVKTKLYETGSEVISKFEVGWCSQDSAKLRAQCCGHSEGGQCYRLYSSLEFQNSFPALSIPEIQRIPVDDILLKLKAMGHVDKVVNFPFPSPPEKEALMASGKRLIFLGALHDPQSGSSLQEQEWVDSAKITSLGIVMSKFPVSPRYAKMLMLAAKNKCITQVAAIVCSLSVPQLSATPTEDDGNEEGLKKIGTGDGKNSKRLGDIMLLLKIVTFFAKSKNKAYFCKTYEISYKAMTEIQNMYTQIVSKVNKVFPESKTPVAMIIESADDEKLEVIRKIMAACLVNHVARKLSREETKNETSLKTAYQCMDCPNPVYIHPSSSQFTRFPEYVVYNEIVKTSKLYMKGIVEIEPEWLLDFAPSLCSSLLPRKDPQPSFDFFADKIYCTMGINFGPWQWEIKSIRKEMNKGFVKYSWFSFFFLSGQVVFSLKKYKGCLLAEPSLVLEPGALLRTMCYPILGATINKSIESKSSLLKEWKRDPFYLLHEFLVWLPEDKHLEIAAIWPPIK